MNTNIYIISTGNELTTGKSSDTNGPWIASEFLSLGYKITKLSILPDNPQIIKNEILSIMNLPGPNLIALTGGMGPTADDHTLNVICDITQKKPIPHEKSVEKLQFISENRGKIYQDIKMISMRQTMIPEDSEALENEAGIAPGFMIDLNSSTRIACFPGVPREMKMMFSGNFLSLFKKKYDPSRLFTQYRIIWGIGETIFQNQFLKDCKQYIDNGLEWGVAAKPGYIKVTYQSIHSEPVKLVSNIVDSKYADRIGNHVFEDVHEMLVSSNKTISTSESCTGGWVGKLLTDMPGSSSYYMGTITAYHNMIKIKMLDVKKTTLDNFGAISEETAREMAIGVQAKMNTDYAISVTGIAGPGGATRDKKIGLVYIGIKSHYHDTVVYKYEIPSARDFFREYVANISLFHLYKTIRVDLKIDQA